MRNGATPLRPHCVYGKGNAPTTVFLIGDLHAAHWFPTFQRLADEQDWRLVSPTKSACPVADVPVYNTALKREYAECDAWRAAVLDRIKDENRRWSSSPIAGQRAALGRRRCRPVRGPRGPWAIGLERSIRDIEALTDHVVVIGDTPRPGHRCTGLRLGPPRRRSLVRPALGSDRARVDRERETASDQTGATFIDPTTWVCPTSPCPAVIGKILVYRDGHHMTTPFARALAPYLEPMLPSIGE